MKKKALIDTNPYLKDPAAREAALIKAVASSSAIEGVHSKGGGKVVFKKPSPVRQLSKSKKSHR